MSERLPTDQEPRKGKFQSDRDELLFTICADGWANESYTVGEGESWIARISNPPEEIEELKDAFAEEAARIGATALDGIQGFFVVVEDGQGFVNVAEYETEEEAIADYRVLETGEVT